MLTHVHIVPQGHGYTLLTGFLKSPVGTLLCKAAKLGVADVENLSKQEAERLAAKLDAWLESQQTDRDKKMRGKIGVRKAARMELEEKYREAMNQ